MSERQYNQEEVAAIFERASERERTVLPAAAEGLTLAALQDIGREVGISLESVSLAARSLDEAGHPASRRFMGLPIGVGLLRQFGHFGIAPMSPPSVLIMRLSASQSRSALAGHRTTLTKVLRTLR